MQVVVVCVLDRDFFYTLYDLQAGNVRERMGVPREVGKELPLAEEDGRVVGMGGLAELQAKQAAVNLLADVLGVHTVQLSEKNIISLREKGRTKQDLLALGEEAKTKIDSG